jgi:hypothetical protein
MSAEIIGGTISRPEVGNVREYVLAKARANLVVALEAERLVELLSQRR